MHLKLRSLSALCLLVACGDADPATDPSAQPGSPSQDDAVQADNASAQFDSEARIWRRHDAGTSVRDASTPVQPPSGAHDASMPTGAQDAATPPSGSHDASTPVGAHDASTPVGAHDASTPVGAHDASTPVGAHDAATPPSGGQDASTPVVVDAGSASDVQQLAQHCVDSINAYRATLNLPPYARAAAKESCVDGEAAADAASNTAHSAFGTCGEWAQNECPGWPSSDKTKSLDGCLKQMWAEGPGDFNAGHGHYINMTSTQYKIVACGIHDLGNGKFWATQDFF